MVNRVIITSIVSTFSIAFLAFLFLNRSADSTGATITGFPDSKNIDFGSFAKCLSERGAVMYGAFWCSHCKQEKDLFGDSFQFINYVECDKNGENANPSECVEKDIIGYPTWIIDGIKQEGFQSLEQLSKYSNCKLN